MGFCEDPTTTQSDEFFGIFDHFITSFAEAKMDNDNAKKRRRRRRRLLNSTKRCECEHWRERKATLGVSRVTLCHNLGCTGKLTRLSLMTSSAH